MNGNTQKGKTPLEARQERLQHLREIYEANKDKDLNQLEKLLTDYLFLEGLTIRKIREYLGIILQDEYTKENQMEFAKSPAEREGI